MGEEAKRYLTTADPAWQKHAAEHWERRYREQHRTLHAMEDELARVRADGDLLYIALANATERIVRLEARRDRLIETGGAVLSEFDAQNDEAFDDAILHLRAAVADARKERRRGWRP